MADPTDYEPGYSFSNFQSNNPSSPLPGPRVDEELEDISASIASIVAAIMDVRRSDGALENAIVTFDSLSPEVRAQVGEGIEEALLAAQAAQEASEDAADASAASAAESAASAQTLSGTSTSSVLLGLGAKNFTTQAGKAFTPGTALIITSDANPTGRILTGIVSSYSGTALVVDVSAFTGTGTYVDWTIRVSGTPGIQGAAGPPGPGSGDMLAANNLSDVANAATARGNLGLGSLATKSTVTASELAATSVGTPALVDASVTTAKIADSNVTFAKMASAAVATQAELEAETASKIVTADLLKNHPGVAKAWVNFNGIGTVAIRRGYNVASITDNGTGNYTVNFTNAMSDANYIVVPATAVTTTGVSVGFAARIQDKTVNGFRILTPADGSATATLTDCAIVDVLVFGDM